VVGFGRLGRCFEVVGEVGRGIVVLLNESMVIGCLAGGVLLMSFSFYLFIEREQWHKRWSGS